MKNFREKIQQKVNEIENKGFILFRSNAPTASIWDLYITSFRKKGDPVFISEDSSLHNCNTCRSFLLRYGNLVYVNAEYEIKSIFDVDIQGEYEDFVKEIRRVTEPCGIESAFFESGAMLNKIGYGASDYKNTFRLGHAQNIKYYKDPTEAYFKKFPYKVGAYEVFNHFAFDAPLRYKTDKSVDSKEAIVKDAYQVFKRGIETIPVSVLGEVCDLFEQNSLLDGPVHIPKLLEFKTKAEEYLTIPAQRKDAWLWVTAYTFKYAKFRNELIGTMCSDLASGVDVEKVCRDWNFRIDPSNFRIVSAPISKRKFEEDKEALKNKGYELSFARKFADILEIKVDNIDYKNDRRLQKQKSIFDNIEPNLKSANILKESDFKNLNTISIEDFRSNILKGAEDVELLLLPKHYGNMVSLTNSAYNPGDIKNIFKWDNDFSYTFSNNRAGKSFIQKEVEKKGGSIDGEVRFSIIWADGDGDNSDLDAHCIIGSTNRVFFKNKHDKASGATLDVDIRHPNGNIAVENIVIPFIKKMGKTSYLFTVNQYAERNSKGFRAEIQIRDEIYTYEYNKRVNQNSNVDVAIVYTDGENATISHKLPCTITGESSKEIYGLQTGLFHKVNLACLSPNYWGANAVGNKFYFFFLENCKADVDIRGFHVENLSDDLIPYKRTLELLGSQLTIEKSPYQLSGVGFNMSMKEDVVVRVKKENKTEMFKIVF